MIPLTKILAIPLSLAVLLPGIAHSAQQNGRNPQPAAQQAKQRAEGYRIPQQVVPQQDKIMAGPQGDAAKKGSAAVDKRQPEIKKYEETLKHGVFQNSGPATGDPNFYQDIQTKTAAKKGAAGLAPDERIYVLISSSIPVETLKAYAEDLALIGSEQARMVIRGFIGGSEKIKPTLQFLASVLNKDHNRCITEGETDQTACDSTETVIDIDPHIFRRYGVTEAVPAIIYAKGVSLNTPDVSEGLGINTLNKNIVHRVIYGDAPLWYMLNEINREMKTPSLTAIIEKIRR